MIKIKKELFVIRIGMKKKVEKLRREIEKIDDKYLKDIKMSALNNLEYGLSLELFFDLLPREIKSYYIEQAEKRMNKILKPFDVDDISNITGEVFRRRSSYLREEPIVSIQKVIEAYVINKEVGEGFDVYNEFE